MKKKIRYILEAALVYIFFTLFRILGFKLSSKLGGLIARSIGPKLKVNNVAINNLNLVMPELSQQERNKIINDMWDNLGRTAAELPNIPKINKYNYKDYITTTGEDYIIDAMKNNEQILFFSSHSANWEISSIIASLLGYEFAAIYRKANNPYVDKIIQNCRKNTYHEMMPKGKTGAKRIIEYLNSGRGLAILTDQKMNDGIDVDFFGIPAMTAPALAKFALKYKTIIIPSFTIRNGSKFEVLFYPPIDLKDKDALEIMTEANKFLEDRIRENPGQWMWVHKRWPESNSRKAVNTTKKTT